MGKANLYAKCNENEMFYTIPYIDVDDNYTYVVIWIRLVAGFDPIAEEWKPASNFAEELQDDYFLQHFMFESVTECLEYNGFTVFNVNDLPFDVEEMMED